jgi:glycerol-3-phosphate acyltransferase PlsX
MEGRAVARVAVDARGGDDGPAVVIGGAIDACRDLGVQVQLVGPEAQLRSELERLGANGLAIEVVHAPESIGMGEKVTRATLKKRSSMHVAVEQVKEGRADAFFSAGNTAAGWTIAKLLLGSLPRIDRPALAAVMPNVSGRTLLLDAGANANCKARHLEEFAVMGDVYAREILGVSEPRIGLMSLGEEDTKGNELTREVHEALKDTRLNYLGNVEGGDLFNGRLDVMVTDGFTGNVALKSSEALAAALMELLKEELMSTAASKLGALLSRGAYRRMQHRIDPHEYGGAPLLGIRGCCVIGHGRSNERAIRQGIRVAGEYFTSGVNEKIESAVESLLADAPTSETA